MAVVRLGVSPAELKSEGFFSRAAISCQRLAIKERGIHGGRGTETISTPAVWKLLPKSTTIQCRNGSKDLSTTILSFEQPGNWNCTFIKDKEKYHFLHLSLSDLPKQIWHLSWKCIQRLYRRFVSHSLIQPDVVFISADFYLGGLFFFFFCFVQKDKAKIDR